MSLSLDAHKNFAYSTVATAPSPAASGTSLVVASGDGTLFPTVSFNATIWPAGANPFSTNAEIVRVTVIATDTFTITRTQEGSSARSIIVGDQIAATITVKTLTDAETKADLIGNTEPSSSMNLAASQALTILFDPLILDSGIIYALDSGSSLNLDPGSALSPPYLSANDYEIPTDYVFYPGTTVQLEDDPLVIDASLLADLGGNNQTLLWLDAPRCPQTISTLLIIGV